MATRSFLPDTDAALLAWSLNFSTLISANPTTYGLTAAQATNYATLHTAFKTAYDTAKSPPTRTRPNVEAKNAARTSLKISARLLASIIDGQASVTNEQKLALGLTIRQMPSPIPPPAFAPAMDIVSVTGRTVRIRLHDSQDASRRGKPAGVNGATLFSFVGATPPAGGEGWDFQGSTGKTLADITFPATLAPGAVVWLTAFWINERKESGPACPPVSTNLAGTNSMAA